MPGDDVGESLDCELDALGERQPVRQPGQRIGVREAPQSELGLLAAGDVGDDAVDDAPAVGQLLAQPHLVLHPPGRAVEPEHPVLDLHDAGAVDDRRVEVGVAVVGMHGACPGGAQVGAGLGHPAEEELDAGAGVQLAVAAVRHDLAAVDVAADPGQQLDEHLRRRRRHRRVAVSVIRKR